MFTTDIPSPAGILTDEDAAAIRAAGGPSAAPPHLRDFFTAQLNQYDAFRVSAPRQVDLQERARKDKLLEDLTLDFDKSVAGQDLPSLSLAPDPETRAKVSEALTVDAYIQAHTGPLAFAYKGATREMIRDAVATSTFGEGKGTGSDTAFMAEAKSYQKKNRDFRSQVEHYANAGLEDALTMEPQDFMDRASRLTDIFKSNSTVGPEDAKKLRETYILQRQQAEGKLAPLRPLAKQIWSTLESLSTTQDNGKKDPSSFDVIDPENKVDSAVGMLADVPDDQRALVISMLKATAGDGKQDNPTASGFIRGLTGQISGAAEKLKRKSLNAGLLELAKDPSVDAVLSNPQAVVERIKSGLSVLTANEGQSSTPPLTLNDSELQQVREGIAKEIKKSEIKAQMKDIFEGNVAPIDASGLAGGIRRDVGASLGAMAPMAVPFAGVAVAWGGYANEEYNRLRALGVDSGVAEGASDITGAVQAGVERAAFLFNFAPASTIGKISAKLTAETPWLVGGKLGLTYGVLGKMSTTQWSEYAEEIAQAAAPAFTARIASALGLNLPEQAGLNAELARFQADGDLGGLWRPDVYATVAALTLVPAGMHGLAETGHAREVLASKLADVDYAKSMGIKPDEAASIAALPADARVDAYRESFKSRDTSTPEAKVAAAAVVEKAKTAAAQGQQEVKDAEAAGITIRRTAAGWDVVDTEDGTTLSHATAEEASATMRHVLETRGIQREDTFLDALDEFTAKMEPGRRIQLTEKSGNLLQELEDASTAGRENTVQSIWDRADEYRASKGQEALDRDKNNPDSRDALEGLMVLGRSSTEAQGNAARSISLIMREGRTLDLVEEQAENDLREAVGAGKTSMAAMNGIIDRIEAATGDKYRFKEGDVGTTEAWARLVRLYTTGTRKGNKITAGARSEMASDFRAERQRLRKAEGQGIAPAAFAKMREYLDYLKSIMGQVSRLMKAKADGKLDDLEAMIRESVGLKEQDAHEAEVVKNTTDLATEAGLIPKDGGGLENVGFSIMPKGFTHGPVYRLQHEEHGGKLKRGDYGLWFSSSEDAVKTYDRGDLPDLITAFLKLKNPLEIDAKGERWDSLEGAVPQNPKIDTTDDVAYWAEQNGYDGVIISNVIDDGKSASDDPGPPSTIYAVFSEKQAQKGLEQGPGFSVKEKPGTLSSAGATIQDSDKYPNPSMFQSAPIAGRTQGVAGGNRDAISFSLKALDSEYLAAVQTGDENKARELIQSAFFATLETPVEPTETSHEDYWRLNRESQPGLYVAYAFDDTNPPGFWVSGKTREEAVGEMEEMLVFSGRATKQSYTYFRSGKIPPSFNSTNYAEGVGEGGVSVYPRPEATSMAGLNARDWYYGSGRQVGTGSDGEPVIIPKGEWKLLPDLKSITRDESGNIIPLSERFNPASDSISYSITSRAQPADTSKRTVLPDGADLIGPTSFSITVYHGTPHKVDRFSLDKIGTGEGAQVFGWGLYFAENKQVAAQYRKALSYKDTKRKFLRDLPEDAEFDEVMSMIGTGAFTPYQERVLKALEADDWLGFDYPAQAISAAYRNVQNWDPSPELVNAIADSGNLYTVDLLPDEADFLDWDKPLNEQSEKVKAALDATGLFAARDLNPPTNFVPSPLFNSGRGAYDILKSNEGSDKKASELLASLGIPGMKYFDGNSRNIEFGTRNYVIFDDKLVKILEENGKPVETAPSYSITTAERLSNVADRLAEKAKDPEQRFRMYETARERLSGMARSVAFNDSTPAGVAEVEFQRQRAAKRQEIQNQLYQQIEEDFGDLSGAEYIANSYNAPIIDELFKAPETRIDKNGKSSTIRRPRLRRPTASGEYDGARDLPMWLFGGTLSADNAAQELADAGLIKDASPDTLWSAIASALQTRNQGRDRLDAYAARRREARDQAATEAETWAAAERPRMASDEQQRGNMLRFLSALDTILMPFPPEVRAKVGGFVKLAGLRTNRQMETYLKDRVEKLDKVLEIHMRKEYTEAMHRLLKKAEMTKGKPGEKAAGKLGPDVQHLMDTVKMALAFTADDVNAHNAALQTKIDSGNLTPEQEALALREIELVQLAGDWNHSDSAKRSAALKAATETYEGGYLEWKNKLIAKRERRAAVKTALIVDTGKAGTLAERNARAEKDLGWWGKTKDFFLSLSSFEEVTRYVFGHDSAAARDLVDAERTAAYAYEDGRDAMADAILTHFRALSKGSHLAGEKLRYRLSQKSIEAGGIKLSEMEAIQALLMWNQEDGKRHMEGPKDENNQPVGPWNYNQAWIDDVASQMTPEGRATMAFIQRIYAAEWATLNPLYRERHGVNLPRHDNYAPITVAPIQAKAGEMVDPVTGNATTGSILTPGSLRTRSRSAIAEPDFKDALQVLLAHHAQMEHWKAYYDFAVEAQAILGNRDVTNSVKAAAGAQADVVMRKWIDLFSQGGSRDAGAALSANQALSTVSGRAARMALIGRVGTLLIQSTQMAAAIAEMPTGAYIARLGKLLSGNLGWGDAIRSEFIQRRISEMPPIVRQAMAGLDTKEPNAIKHAVARLGTLISGTDGLFTAGTYAMLLDYHRGQAAKQGFTGPEADSYAHAAAARATERVAQPTRPGTRSLFENTATSPMARLGWAFASEARQKIALAAWAGTNAKTNPSRAARVAFLTWAVGGLMAQVIRNAWRDWRDDDDDEIFDDRNWSLKQLAASSLTGPLQGIPGFGEALQSLVAKASGGYEQSGNLLSGLGRSVPAVKNIVTGDFLDESEPIEETMKDVEAILMAAGLANDTIAATASLMHIIRDGTASIDAMHDDPAEIEGKAKREKARDAKERSDARKADRNQ